MAVLSGAQLSGEPARTLDPAPISSRFLCPRPLLLKQQQQQQQQILLKIGKKLITLLSHPQIAYKLIEAGGAEDVLQNKIYIQLFRERLSEELCTR